ncbi:MAG: hypothetical protein AAF570_15365, partial [Bacteroidota bacterium]
MSFEGIFGGQVGGCFRAAWIFRTFEVVLIITGVRNYLLCLFVGLTSLFCANEVQGQIANNLTLLSNWDNNNLPNLSGVVYNDIWGWVDNSGKEYAIMGTLGATLFIDVTDPANPILRDSVPGQFDECIHRDFKTYQNYC